MHAYNKKIKHLFFLNESSTRQYSLAWTLGSIVIVCFEKGGLKTLEGLKMGGSKVFHICEQIPGFFRPGRVKC